MKGTKDLDPLITTDTLLADLNRGGGVAPGSITHRRRDQHEPHRPFRSEDDRGRHSGDRRGDAGDDGRIDKRRGDGIRIGTTLAGGDITINNMLGGSTATDLGIYQPTPARGGWSSGRTSTRA